jgi:hypothetical protein
MTEVLLFEPVNRFIWVVAILVLFICGLIYVFVGHKKERSEEKIMMLGCASLFIGLAITRIFFYFSDFHVIGDYSGHYYYGDYANTTSTYDILILGGYISGFVGIGLFLLSFEIVIKRTKYVLTLTNVVFIILIIINRRIFFILVSIDMLIIVIILIWLTKKSSKEFKDVAAFIMIGYIVYVVGTFLDTRAIKELNVLYPTIPAFFMIIGAIIMISPTLIKPEKISQSLHHWVILIIIATGLLIFNIYFVFYFDIPILYRMGAIIILFIFFLILGYTMNRMIKIIRPQRAMKKPKETKADTIDILRVFTRPKKITEEEVSFHKEKKICLVCKGKLLRLLFMCPECDALYCVKCSNALSEAENACWVCESPIDESKPVNLPESYEEKIKDKEKDIHKKFTN